MLRKTAALLLLSFCACYAAPVALVLSLNRTTCCCAGKNRCSCKRPAAAGWVADSPCRTQCGVSISAPPVAGAPPITEFASPAPIRPLTLFPRRTAPASRSYPAFLYQLPPPAIG